ncbi:MAG: hypothetical protein ACXW4C_10960 [Nitrospira sp.]
MNETSSEKSWATIALTGKVRVPVRVFSYSVLLISPFAVAVIIENSACPSSIYFGV